MIQRQRIKRTYAADIFLQIPVCPLNCDWTTWTRNWISTEVH